MKKVSTVLMQLRSEDFFFINLRVKALLNALVRISLCLYYTSHIKLSTVYMYPHISSWRHSEKRADSNQPRAYKTKRRGTKLTRETALAREKRIFHFPHLVSPASLLQNRHSYRNFALFIPRGNKVTKTLVHTTS